MELSVLMNGDLAGTLSYTPAAHLYAFRYSPSGYHEKIGTPSAQRCHSWRRKRGVESRTMQRCASSSKICCPGARRWTSAASTYRLSKGNLMGLLAALGGGAAGALQLRLRGARGPVGGGDPSGLSHEELSERIRARPSPAVLSVGRAGAVHRRLPRQDCGLQDEGRWAFVKGARTASTHILKPEPVSARFLGSPGTSSM